MNNNMSQNSFHDRREERRQRRLERHGGEWVLGVVLILLAVVLLMQNLNIINLTNWWAFFILIPALGSFGTAWGVSRQAGNFNRNARGAVIAGLLLTLVSAMFLFNLNWTILGPILLVLAGAGLLVNSFIP